MRKIKEFGALIVIILICVCIVGGSVLAEDGEYNRRNRIASKGVFNFSNNTVMLDSSDLTYLADEIDDLERTYKSSTMEALNRIGTFYTSTDGSISHNCDDNHVSSDMAAELLFSDLYQGILKSQSVEHLAGVQAEDTDGNPLYYADQGAGESHDLIRVTKNANDYPLFIQPANAKNLTAGTAAWVDGELIIGNGGDNTAYHDNGKNEGYDSGYNEGVNQAKYKGNWRATIRIYLSGYNGDVITANERSARVYVNCKDGKVSIDYPDKDWLNGFINCGSGSTQVIVHNVILESFQVY